MSRVRTTTSDSVDSEAPAAAAPSRITRSRATPRAKPVVAGRPTTGTTARAVPNPRLAPQDDAQASSNESPTKPPTTGTTATRLTSLKNRAVSRTVSEVVKPSNSGVRPTSRVAPTRTARTPVSAKREGSKILATGEVDELAAKMQNALTMNGNAKASSSISKPLTSTTTARQKIASETNPSTLVARARTRPDASTSVTPASSAGPTGKRTIGSKSTPPSSSRPPLIGASHSRSSTAPSQSTESPERLAFLPPNTLLHVKPEALDAIRFKEAKANLNKSIADFKSAQAEGYHYERLGADKSSGIGQRQLADGQKAREWTDATMKVAVDNCWLTLRQLTGHLLSAYKSGPEWISEALMAVQWRMQLAKACSDFGLHASTIRIVVETRSIILNILGHGSDSPGEVSSLQEVFYLPRPDEPIESFETKERLAVFSWLSMLWLAFVNKANSSDKQNERTAVLEVIAASRSPAVATRLQFLDMSRRLEGQATKSYLLLLYTRIGKLLSGTVLASGSSTDGDVTEHLLLLLAATASQAGRVTFASLWSQTRREGERLAKKADRMGIEENHRLNLENGASVVGMIEHVVQTALERNGSDLLNEWRSNKEWQGLMEFWLGLYRALGDLQGVEKVLCLMSAEAASPSVVSEVEALLEPGLKALTLNGESGSSSLSVTCGRLVKLATLLDQAGLEAMSQELGVLLRDVKLLTALGTVCKGQSGKDLLYTLSKISRAIDPVRSRLDKIIASAKQGQPVSARLLEGCYSWLGNAFSLVEALLNGPGAIEEYYEQYTTLTAIAIDIAMTLSKSTLIATDAGSRGSSLDLLLRAEKLFRASRAPSVDLPDWARCISNAAWSCGAGVYRTEQFTAATPFIRMAVQLGDHALDTFGTAPSPGFDQEWDFLRVIMSARWEALSVCLSKEGAKLESLDARIHCIKAHVALTPDLELESASRPLLEIFDSHNKLAASLNRLSSAVASDALFYANLEEKFENKIFDTLQTTTLAALMAEHLAACLQPLEYRAEVAGLIQALLRKAIEAYKSSQCPIRQVRCSLRLLENFVSTGAPIAEGEELLSECFVLLQGDPKRDRGLDDFINQYEADLHMTQVSIAYSARSAALVETLGRHADAARQSLLNLSGFRSRVSASPNIQRSHRGSTSAGGLIKSPVLFRIDDRRGLCTRLDKFIGLLGMHNHAFRQIEFLRLKRGLERADPALRNDFLVTSARLASEYARLGKYHRAGAIFVASRNVLSKTAPTALSLDERVSFELRYALYLAATGNIEKSEEIYSEVRRISQPEVQQKLGSSTAKIRQRCATLERAAMANLVLAEISHMQDDAVGTIRHRSVAFRLLSRAAENMARIAPKAISDGPKAPETPLEDPFGPLLTDVKPEDAPPVDDVRRDPKSSHLRGKQLVGWHLSLVAALLRTSVQLASDMLVRGSARDALGFAKEAKSLAEIAGSQYWRAKTSCIMSEIHIALRDYDAAAVDIEESTRVLTELGGPESAEAQCILAELQSRQVDTEEDTEMIEAAEQAFEATKQALKRLESSFARSDGVAATPGKSTGTPVAMTATADAEDAFMATTRSRVLMEQARLLRRLDRLDESNELLEEARNGSLSEADELHILGTTAFSAALTRFKSDLFLNSITESTISMPMGMVDAVDDDIRNDRNPIALTLQDAESAYQDYISLRGNSGDVTDVRDATVAIAMLRAYQASLGRNSVEYTRGAAALLDSSCSITLQRELLEVQADGEKGRREDEMLWPARVPGAIASRSISDDENCATRHEIRQETRPVSNPFDQQDLSNMPDDWCAISINVTEDQSTMFISRSQRGRQPVIFTLPLDRQGKREEEDECFTLDAALTELRQIISESDASARNAKDVDRTSKVAKTQWWADRKALDQRLQELLDSIEFCWLGAFKTIFNPASGRSPKALTAFRKNLEDTFARALNHGDKSRKSRIQLDDNIVECFSTLSSKSKDQEFEDLVYFILDLHQFNGVGVALAEIDIEQLSMDVQTALQQFDNGRRAESIAPVNNEHIFLILDRKVQEIPWESIPILRGRAVSRVPSMAFLMDRLPPTISQNAERREVAPQKVFYILNPSGDLDRTQKVFEPWLKAMSEKCGWRGISGREPTSLEIKAALQTNDLVLYFGHGGMEQYISSRAIRELPKCATVMIWGCSSGLLKDQGDLDRIGNPYNYMVAGAPSFTAVLWDVTDAEIDKIAQSTASQLRMDESHTPRIDETPAQLADTAVSNVQALSKARDCCKLKYLTGAAPVTYGVPFYFR